MRRRALDLIVCPVCKSDFNVFVTESNGDDIVSGQLQCCGCNRTYPIRRSIPRLLPGALPLDRQRTSDAFGWEWTEFRELHALDRYQEQFLNWISPIEPSFFAGKVVLDAGCGMGRFAVVSAKFGARDVIALDLSDAVEVAAENARPFPNVHVIQGDIFNLPLRSRTSADHLSTRAVVDFAYSIGVLHHLPDPRAGFLAIAEHLKANGNLFAWVYGRENNGWIVRIVNPIRQVVSSRLPRRTLYCGALLIAALLQATLRVIYRPTARVSWLQIVHNVLPYRAYLDWLSGFGFRHNHHVVFDHLVAPTAFYITRAEFETWFGDAGLTNVKISWRNENSWRGLGEVPTRAASRVPGDS